MKDWTGNNKAMVIQLLSGFKKRKEDKKMTKVYYRNNKAYEGLLNLILGRKSKRVEYINQCLKDNGFNEKIKHVAGSDRK